MNIYTNNKDFLFEIIHDLKAPILSMDFVLKNTKRTPILEEIYKMNKHNLNYINDLISSYSFFKGRYCVKYEVVNSLDIINEEITSLNPLIEEKGLNFFIKNENLADYYIISDKNLFRQIVLNLLTNAVKYSPFNSTISITFKRENEFLNICFKNPFEKSINNVNSTKFGLEIVKRKVKILGGKLKINKNNKEICFNLEFEYR